MAIVTLQKGEIHIDNDSDALTEISAGTTMFALVPTKAVGRYTPVNANAASKTEGGRDWVLNGRVVVSNTSTEAFQLLREWYMSGGERDFEVYKPADAVGNDSWIGSGILASLSDVVKAEGGSGDAYQVDFKIEVNGDPTYAVVAGP